MNLSRSIRPSVRANAGRIVGWRRDFHAHPELSWHEERTQARILELLAEIGAEDIRPIARTGVTCLVSGKRKSRALAWRADVDALPIPEASGVPFASATSGVSHACGHDGHIAIALGIAEALIAERERLDGVVRFVFQPAEEDNGGAEACIADGVLRKPEVERVLGLHLSADIPLGTVNVAPGPFFAAPTWFQVTINGTGGHAAAPHLGVDAIVVAAHVITALQSVVSRSVAPSDSAVLTIGTVAAGYRWNVIADSATLTGTIRAYSDHVTERMLERVRELVYAISAGFGASAEVTHSTGIPLVNDPAATASVERECVRMFGEENIYGSPSMGADDMAVFLRARPGCYFWLGARNEEKGIAGRHHDPGFMIDEEALIVGVELGLRVIEGSFKDLR